MNIVFFRALYENIGVEYLSAYLKKSGHQTSLFFDPRLFRSFLFRNDCLDRISGYKDRLVKKAIDSGANLICISSTTTDYVWACSIAKKIKEKKDIPIIFGGFHPTAVPERVIKEDFVDFVCVGEGEEALLELVNALESGKKTTDIANIWCKEGGKVIANPPRPLVSDLDSLPFPDKDLFYNEYKGFSSIYTILSGRGCPLACTFCFNSLLRHIYKDKGPYLRRRSVDNVIEELRLAKNKYDIKEVFFADDIFIYDIKWLREFSRKYKYLIGLPFFCEAYPSFVNEEAVNLLRAAGCATINMGIQTISEDLRSRYLHREDTNEQIEAAIRLFRKNNIFINLDIIFSLPGQGEEEALDIARFFNRNRPDHVKVISLEYFPKTKIVEIAREKGILTNKDIDYIEEGRAAEFYTTKHDISFNKNLGRIANLVIISYLIPRKLMNFIIKNKLYRYYPKQTPLLWKVLLIFVVKWHSRIFARSKLITQFLPLSVLRFYIYYLKKYLPMFSSHNLKGLVLK